MNIAVTEALKRCFAEKRVVFWYDEGGKCRGEFDEVEIDGVDKLVIAGNEFGIKYKILFEKPDRKFLVYSPKAQPAPADVGGRPHLPDSLVELGGRYALSIFWLN